MSADILTVQAATWRNYGSGTTFMMLTVVTYSSSNC
jgi:hypothetical protein